MKTTRKNRVRSISYATWTAVALLWAGAARAQDAEAYQYLTRTVPYGDLNLETPRGVEILYARLRQAANDVCAPFDNRWLSQRHTWQECYDHAISAAVAQIDKASLTALHKAQPRGAKVVKAG